MLSSLVGRELGTLNKQEVKDKVELSPAWLCVEGMLKVHPNIHTSSWQRLEKLPNKQ